MPSTPQRSLAAKLTLAGTPFLLLALLATAATLWVSWQLDGGAAAVNEAGRMRMQAYRMALSASTGQPAELPALVREFEGSLSTLRHGDPERPVLPPEALFLSSEHFYTLANAHAQLALRPGTADRLPYLGVIPGVDNGFIAAGHFRSGLQLSPATAIVMAQLIRGQKPEIDLRPFAVARG